MQFERECNLYNVKVSDESRKFGGMLDDFDDYKFKRFFGILVDDRIGIELDECGYPIRDRKTPQTRNGEYPILLNITIDYEALAPQVEAVIEDKEISLNEKTIGCLDAMEIDYVNLSIIPEPIYDDRNIRVGQIAYLKNLKAYLKKPEYPGWNTDDPD